MTENETEQRAGLADVIVRAWCGVDDDLTWRRTTDARERDWLRSKAVAVLSALEAEGALALQGTRVLPPADPICNERGVPESECPAHCLHTRVIPPGATP